MKFGGTSVATVSMMQSIGHLLKEYYNSKTGLVVVLSAMGETTNTLYAQASQISPRPDARSLDLLLSQGEQISIALMAMVLVQQGIPAIALTATQAGIRVTGSYGDAKVQCIHTQHIKKHWQVDKKVCVVAGFQGIHLDRPHEICTLGRGGSDTSALALAAALGCHTCEIYTDVDGVFTANPNHVPNAKLLQTIDYEEMLEMSRLGAGVLHSRCVSIAAKFGIAIHVRSSKKRSSGTLIFDRQRGHHCKLEQRSKDFAKSQSKDFAKSQSKDFAKSQSQATDQTTGQDIMQHSVDDSLSSDPSLVLEGPVITGVSAKTDEARLTVHHVPDRPGLAAELFQELGAKEINVNMIVQSTAMDKTNSISFTMLQSELEYGKEIMQNFVAKQKMGTVEVDPKIGIISVVGRGMISSSGIAGTMFAALAKEKINIEMISTSEIKLSVAVDYAVTEQALKVVHAALVE